MNRKFFLILVFPLLAFMTLSSHALSEEVIYATLYRDGKQENLVNHGKISISGSQDCIFMMTWGGNMYPNLKSGIENGFFFTEMGGFLLAIPTDKNLNSWEFKKSHYRYVPTLPPKGVALPVEKFQTIEVKFDGLVRYVYVADRYNYIGDTSVFNKTKRTIALKKYRKEFYECMKK